MKLRIHRGRLEFEGSNAEAFDMAMIFAELVRTSTDFGYASKEVKINLENMYGMVKAKPLQIKIKD